MKQTGVWKGVGRLPGVVLVAMLGSLLAACGSDDAPEALSNKGQPDGRAPQPTVHEGPYEVGDVYDDGEFKAKYLGLARLGLGRNGVWPDGECFAFLVEAARYNDHLNSGGVDTFTPSTRGILADGTEAERDSSGVGCDTGALRASGYSSTHKAKLRVGESAKVYTGTFRLAPDQVGTLKGVQLYGGSELFVPKVTVEAVATQ